VVKSVHMVSINFSQLVV